MDDLQELAQQELDAIREVERMDIINWDRYEGNKHE